MKILITALLSFLIAFSPMAVYAAEPSTEIEVPEFDSVTGDTSGMHKEIKPVRGTGTTLENCAPGKLKFYSIKGKTYQDSTAGKQLFNPTLDTCTLNGITCTNNGDGTYTLNGTSSLITNFVFTVNLYANSDLKFILFGSLVDGLAYADCYIENQGFGYKTNDENGVIIQQGLTVASFTLLIHKGVTINNLVVKPMFTEDLNATYDDFEPYSGGATPNPLYPQKYESVLFDKIKVYNNNGEQNEVDFITSVFLLNGIGNVRDEITDSKMIQRIGEIVFDGSSDEGWYLSSAVTGRYLIPIDGLNATTFNVLCTHAIKGKYSSTLNVNTCFAAGAGHFCIDTPFATLAEWKSHLAENPMSVLYELKEPIETDLSQADIFNLAWLDTYEGTNYISFVGSPLVPDIEVEYSAYFEKIYDSALQSFVSFMKVIFNFVATEFTIWGFTFSYWQIIVLTCLAGMAGYFIREAFGG